VHRADNVGGVELAAPADLADQDHGPRITVGLEHPQHIRMAGPDHWITAQAYNHTLSEAKLVQRIDDLVGQRAALGDDADRARHQQFGVQIGKVGG
jgi:hypothetical protein